MIAIRARWSRGAAVVCLLVLGASGCGLSAELDRERNPERSPTPTPSVPFEVPPAMSATPERPHAVPVQPDAGCPRSGVRFRTGPVNAAMGLRATTLTLTNCGTRPYALDGYPVVRVLDEEGAPMAGVRTVAGTDEVPMAPREPGPRPLTLAPGESAEAGLYWRMAAEKSTYLRVGSRRDRDLVTIRPGDYLDIGPVNVLGTTPWVASTP
ncbi:DUF4232 domain-containing protein [Streptomyces sp. NPDC054842]